MQGVSREVGNLFMIAKAVFFRSVNVTALVFGALSDLCLVPNIAKYVLHFFFFFFLLLRYMQAYNIAFLPKEKKFLFQFRLGFYRLILKHCIAQ